ncbi:hypothetical protein KGO95_01655 [Patescibacteria group bacterium]|nr:hypothetical protein [Patescibacteria group bacterium]
MEQTLMWTAAFIVAAILLISLGPWLYKRHTEQKKKEFNDYKVGVYTHSEANGYVLGQEFRGLVLAIAHYHAAIAGKLMTTKEADANHDNNEKLILTEDEEDAFRQALKELSCEGSRCVVCDKLPTLLEKVRRLRKEYERKYELEKQKEQERRKKKPL